MWARFPGLLGFMQLAEAEPAMTDTVVAGMQKFAVCMHGMLTANYTGAYLFPALAYSSFALCTPSAQPQASFSKSVLETN
jgi:hypothetical protein